MERPLLANPRPNIGRWPRTLLAPALPPRHRQARLVFHHIRPWSVPPCRALPPEPPAVEPEVGDIHREDKGLSDEEQARAEAQMAQLAVFPSDRLSCQEVRAAKI